ncbi:UNKNOWN [Stylonychia lemnae]|uniref:Uncharacterized protein n=1 Tax=Stylonychia lemnae TaxID=5949 RepID=A0A078A7Z6_STYLE|nr:UNKNOWN [Stylonychia lemnae]|eukprot:CDW77707.1 UNKNOWN [Stylonychia lemnae]
MLSPQEQASKLVTSPMQIQEKHQYHYDRRSTNEDIIPVSRQASDQQFFSQKSANKRVSAGDIDISIEFPKPDQDIFSQEHFSQINEESKEISTYRMKSNKNNLQEQQDTKHLLSNHQTVPEVQESMQQNNLKSKHNTNSLSESQMNSTIGNGGGMGFLDLMKQAQEHFQDDQQQHETASSNIDESIMNAYREVVPKTQFEALKNENARIRRDLPSIKDNLENMKIQTRNVENEVNFLMAGVENTEEIKQNYEKKVKQFDNDIEIVKRKIDQAVLDYTDQKIKTQNLDLAFKRIMNTLILNCQQNKNQIMDDNLRQLFKELNIKDKQKFQTPVSTTKSRRQLSKQTIGSSFLDESKLSLKTVQGYNVNEAMIAKIDNLEKELIKKKYELQIVRKDLYNNLEKDQKEKLIQDLQRFGESAVTELVKVFTVQDSKKQPKKMDEIKSLPTKDFKSTKNSQKS